MAIAASAAGPSPDSGAWAQIQLRLAQRNADRAEQQARALRAQADEAQTVASQAQENARALRVESSQARIEADSAERGVVALKSLNEVARALGELRAQATPARQSPVFVQQAMPAVEINPFGQTTGTLVNVMA